LGESIATNACIREHQHFERGQLRQLCQTRIGDAGASHVQNSNVLEIGDGREVIVIDRRTGEVHIFHA